MVTGGKIWPRQGTGRGAGCSFPEARGRSRAENKRLQNMNSIIYIVGLVVVVLFILSMLGLR